MSENLDISLKQIHIRISKKVHHMQEEAKSQSSSEKISYEGSYRAFPWRPTINFFLILLSTLQVIILVDSRIYLRGELVRTFLSVYMEQQAYPELFEGNAFYASIKNVEDLSKQLQFTFNQINSINESSFLDMQYSKSHMYLQVQYKDGSPAQSTFNITPSKGILHPFNMSNITDLQLFLLKAERFYIRVENLTIEEKWEGFSDNYKHELMYVYEDSIQIKLKFKFAIDDAFVTEEDDEVMQGYMVESPSFIFLYLVELKLFYGIVMVLSCFSLFFNYLTIKTTYRLFYQQLSPSASDKNISLLTEEQNSSELGSGSLLNPSTERLFQNKQTIYALNEKIKKCISAHNITISSIKFSHYLHVLEADVVFSVICNLLLIVTGFYLVVGLEREHLAGMGCLFAWLTLFRFIRNQKKLVLMYQLIKLSLIKVILFFLEFLPVFMGFAIMGVCIFPKVSFFFSLDYSVTTLISLMMGDSICLITMSIADKNSIFIAILYIFSFVLLFMHAIHNTLTSLIKQFFLIKKIELILDEKASRNQHEYVYLQELKQDSEERKDKLPLRLSNSLQRFMIREKNFGKTDLYVRHIEKLILLWDEVKIDDNMVVSGYVSPPVRQFFEEQIYRRHQMVVDSILKFKEMYGHDNCFFSL